LYIVDYFQINREVFAKRLDGFALECTRSSAVHYTDVARGTADAALECTRKQNLEIAVAYGLVTEAGGVMVTLDGASLGQKLYRAFSQDRHTPIITAATRELADDIIQHIMSHGALPEEYVR
jgi:fructose-1,6-bisphosphatase/inositol monophosphatase family enzyme